MTGNPAGRTGRYLKYAIGEIVLVMVGILLALQVNNWNEERKARLKEYKILSSLKSEIVSNLWELKKDAGDNQTSLQSTLDIYDYIQHKSIEADSMYEDFYNSISFNYFFPKTSNYQTLRSGNLDIIRSDSIRDVIINVYDSGFKRIIDKVETRRNAARILFPYYQKNFTTKFVNNENSDSSIKRIGIPVDYNRIINDPEYETLITEAILGRWNFKRGFESTIQSTEKCIDMIHRYLNN